MRRLLLVVVLAMMVGSAFAQKAKYVFYFIGDGMGVNHVNGTEMYLAELEGRIGTTPLLCTTFPVASMATTFSVTNSVTDSSAGGTALACGTKTYNGAIGVDKDKNPVQSVAEKAKAAGKRVGVTTSVSVDHATPASFYAHQPERNMYYEIALDLPKAGFDFYAGGGFLKPTTTADKKEAPSIFPIIEEAGYTVARGVDEYKAKAGKADKMVLIQKEDANQSCLPYAIDRQEGDMTLAEITESAIDFLSRGKGNKGFFLMVEGGKIDWSSHDNDAATTFKEVIDMDNAIRVAYEFYKKHPKETLIVVTADHETGGLGLGTTKYELNLKALAHQAQSRGELSRAVSDMRRMRKRINWQEAKELLAEKMGFWEKLPVSWEQERRLRDAFEESFVKKHVVFEERLYSTTEPLAAEASRVMSEISLVGWTSPNHTAGYVPVFAIGAGSQLFSGKMDNIEIPARIAKAAGY